MTVGVVSGQGNSIPHKGSPYQNIKNVNADVSTRTRCLNIIIVEDHLTAFVELGICQISNEDKDTFWRVEVNP